MSVFVCRNCKHWSPPDPSDGARDPRFGWCKRIENYELAREPAPPDEVLAFVESLRGGELNTREGFSCGLFVFKAYGPLVDVVST